MSSYQDLEEAVAARFGEIKDGQPFTVDRLEDYVAKMEKFEEEKNKEFEEQLRNVKVKERNRLVCPNQACRNSDENKFEKDERLSQVTCQVCGTVAKEREVRDTEWVRHFEDEVNPSFHGPPPDPRFSSAHNLQTGMVVTGNSKASGTQLQETRAQIEMNLSNLKEGNQGKTRQGYKDKMKKNMFETFSEVGKSLQLNDKLMERAGTLFAKLRDDTEQLNNRYEHAAACLILAMREKKREEASTASLLAETPVATVPTKFYCKYCNLDFVLKRDRNEHQKHCDLKPAAETSDNSTPTSNNKKVKTGL